MKPRRGFDADHPAGLASNAGDLAILDDVDPALIGAAGIAPGHGIMADGAAAALQEPALDRKAGILEIEERKHGFDRASIEQLGVDAMQPHGISAAAIGIALRIGMVEVEHAALCRPSR